MSGDAETSREIRELMNQAGDAMLTCAKVAIDSVGLEACVIVVKHHNDKTICVGLCDRARIAAKPPGDMLPTQIAMITSPPNRDEILVMLFAKHSAGVGRITLAQIRAQMAKGMN